MHPLHLVPRAACCIKTAASLTASAMTVTCYKSTSRCTSGMHLAASSHSSWCRAGDAHARQALRRDAGRCKEAMCHSFQSTSVVSGKLRAGHVCEAAVHAEGACVPATIAAQAAQGAVHTSSASDIGNRPHVLPLRWLQRLCAHGTDWACAACRSSSIAPGREALCGGSEGVTCVQPTCTSLPPRRARPRACAVVIRALGDLARCLSPAAVFAQQAGQGDLQGPVRQEVAWSA